jgi:hypothetical protein
MAWIETRVTEARDACDEMARDISFDPGRRSSRANDGRWRWDADPFG